MSTEQKKTQSITDHNHPKTSGESLSA